MRFLSMAHICANITNDKSILFDEQVFYASSGITGMCVTAYQALRA